MYTSTNHQSSSSSSFINHHHSFWLAPSRVHSAVDSQQSPEHSIPSHIDCFNVKLWSLGSSELSSVTWSRDILQSFNGDISSILVASALSSFHEAHFALHPCSNSWYLVATAKHHWSTALILHMHFRDCLKNQTVQQPSTVQFHLHKSWDSWPPELLV